MKISEPIGNSLYAPLLIRIPLGIYLLMFGWYSISNPLVVVKALTQLHVLPAPLGTLYGVLLPYVSFASGACIIVGSFTTLAAFIMAVMSIPWLLFTHIITDGILNRDVIILGATISLMYSGAGAFSIDRFRRSG